MRELITTQAQWLIEGDRLDFSADSNFSLFTQRTGSVLAHQLLIENPMRGADPTHRRVSAIGHWHGDVVVELDDVDKLVLVDTYPVLRYPSDASHCWHDAGVEEVEAGDLLWWEGDPLCDLAGRAHEVVAISLFTDHARLVLATGEIIVTESTAVVRRMNPTDDHQVTQGARRGSITALFR